MALEFTLNEFGRTFATRGRAAQLRDELVAHVRNEDILILDFAGVTNVTYSFADEFVGKLTATIDGQVVPRNMSPAVARVVERALQRRTGAVSC